MSTATARIKTTTTAAAAARSKKTHLGKAGGAGGSKKKVRTAVMGITNPAIRRLCRRAGIPRIKFPCYDHLREEIQHGFLKTVLQDAITLTAHRKHRTVNLLAMNGALRRHKSNLLGFYNH